jgi:predicted nucleic acid-binding protein
VIVVLDTNVISELARPEPSLQVLTWVDGQDEVAITATTAAELLYGIARLPDGARKVRLADGIRTMIDGPLRERVLAFDRDAASHYAEIVSAREDAGRPIAIADAQIAAICRARGATLGTRNVRDFESVGITVINPWDHGSDPEG